MGPVILLVSALLTAGYLFPIAVQGFLPGKEFDKTPLKKCEAGLNMTIPMMILALASLFLGMFSNSLIGWLELLAQSLM